MWDCIILSKNFANLYSGAGFPKLLVHRCPLDTVAGLHVPPKFCDVSLKKRLSVRITGVPSQKIWEGNKVLPKSCDVCPNHDFLVLYG